MLTRHFSAAGQATTADAADIDGTWFDLVGSDATERARVEAATGLRLPDREHLGGIELSNRVGIADDVLRLGVPYFSHAAEADQQRVHERPSVDVDDDARDQQDHAGNEEPERAEAPVAAEAERERRQREHARERDEAALERVIGEKTEAQCRQHREQQRQRRAVQCAHERRRRPETIGEMGET